MGGAPTQILNAYFTSAGDSTSWVHESYDFVPTDALGRYTISFFDITGYASVLDNVVLEPVPEPSGAVLLGGSLLVWLLSGLCGAGGARRRR